MTASITAIDTQYYKDSVSQWLDAAEQGDRTAFERLYGEHKNQVYSVCLRILQESSLAEDATQETFIQVWRSLSKFNRQSRFSTWIHSVATNVAISYARKQTPWWKRIFSIEDHHVDDVAADADANYDLSPLLARLPQQARLVFILHAVEGFRHQEIAEKLGIAEGSSKAQFFRAKQLIKQWMGYE